MYSIAKTAFTLVTNQIESQFGIVCVQVLKCGLHMFCILIHLISILLCVYYFDGIQHRKAKVYVKTHYGYVMCI